MATASSAVVHAPDGAVLVADDGTIAWSGPWADRPAVEATVVDHHGSFLLPGFVDTHLHYPQVHCVDAHGGGQLLAWLEKVVFPGEAKLADPAFARDAARALCDRLVRAGTTTSLVFGSQFPAAQEVLAEEVGTHGLRMITGRTIMTTGPSSAAALVTDDASALALARAEIDQWQPRLGHASPFAGVALVPRFALSVTPATLASLGELYEESRELGVYVTTHLSENRTEVADVLSRFAVRDYLDVYDGRFRPGSVIGGASLLGRRTVLAHAVHCHPRELRRLSETGTSIAHCPVSQDFLGSGTMPWRAVVGSGTRVAMGSRHRRRRRVVHAARAECLLQGARECGRRRRYGSRARPAALPRHARGRPESSTWTTASATWTRASRPTSSSSTPRAPHRSPTSLTVASLARILAMSRTPCCSPCSWRPGSPRSQRCTSGADGWTRERSMGDAIRFWHGGEIVELDGVPATTTVLEWLRTTRRSLGTKEGCNEGDCGACAVVLGRPDGEGGLSLTMAHACLLLVPMLHGTALFTIEDLAEGDGLHPVQREMVDRLGSQCGFCTPGIVMSLWRMREQSAESGEPLNEAQVRTGLAGHVCRCTGYRSIVEAGVASGTTAGDRLDRSPALAALAESADDGDFEYVDTDTRFVAPATLAGLVRVRRDRPAARVIGGGTDLVPAVPGRGELPTDVIWTGRVAGLADIADAGAVLSIGAGASIERSWEALVLRWPHLLTGWQRFASPAVRETGTLGGNLVTASPIGDSAPVLLALDAAAMVAGTTGERTIPLPEFFVGYRRTALEPGEVLVRVLVPVPEPAWDVRMFKVARRFDNDIATVSLAVALQLEGDRIAGARVAFGGMAAVPGRASGVEIALVGQDWDRRALTAAQEALAADVQPMSDHRGSAAYRLAVARGLLERWWLQTRPRDPLTPEQTEVWGVS